jgi:hypothetical protein
MTAGVWIHLNHFQLQENKCSARVTIIHVVRRQNSVCYEERDQLHEAGTRSPCRVFPILTGGIIVRVLFSGENRSALSGVSLMWYNRCTLF